LAKTKKRQHRKEGVASLELEGEEFPSALTVELWHRRPKGKRVLIGSRRYDMAPDAPPTTTADTVAVEAEPEMAHDGVEAGTTAKSAAAKPAAAKPAAAKRPRQARPKKPPAS
jgi:hypothetical protein